MSPDEHQLINGLFERMRQMGPIEKDRDAESFIMQSVLATPDAAYKLVQSVLVQEMALQQANERIEQLEAQTRQPAPQVAQQSSGGFFGGLFGGNKPAPQQPVQRASVPPMGGARPAGSPWSGQQAAPGGYQQGGYQQQPMQQQAGGGFMKTAMATAAGVAGGMLVAGAIGNMMSGGGTARAAGTGDQASGGAGGGETSPYEVAQGGQEPQYQDPSANDPGTYEQQADTSGDEGGGGWFGGGGDDGGGDSEF